MLQKSSAIPCMSFTNAFWRSPLLEQDGTSSDDEFNAAIAVPDGSIILAGYTRGRWETTDEGNQDFAAVSLDADGKEMWRYQVSGFPRGSLRTGSRCLDITGFTPGIGEYMRDHQATLKTLWPRRSVSLDIKELSFLFI